jgi:aryl-alcohol dehydrogenase-like predicted oxidoreductase
VIARRPLGGSGLPSSVLGMGCSRLGSLLTAGGERGAERALEAALGQGIAFFDTADVYAQGDSERLLGRVLGATDTVTIATKAGYLLPAPRWALRLAKPPLRLAARLRGAVGRSLAARRRQGFAQNFAPEHLRRALRGSLKRLGRERIDLFMLHNPPPESAEVEALWRFVEDAKRAGELRCFGVSCGGDDADIAWLRHDAVEVVQVPLGPDGAATDGFLAMAADRNVGVVAREILGGPGRHEAAAVEAALRRTLSRPEVAVALVGMTQSQHVQSSGALVRRVAAPAAMARSA